MSPSFTMSRKLVGSCVLSMSLLVISCATKHYGGGTELSITAGETTSVFVIPTYNWRTNGQERMLKSDALLSQYRFGNAPVSRPSLDGTYVLAWRCGSEWRTKPIDVRMGRVNTASVECK